jgi:glutathione S-transferase
VFRLYSGPLSLFSRKVEIALREKGLPFEQIMVPFDQTVGYSPKHPDVIAANPKKQVPVLNDGGLMLYDSTIILEYLEDAYPRPPLYPLSSSTRAHCRMLELFADEIMLNPLRSLMHRTEPRPDDAAGRAELDTKAKLAENVLRDQQSFLDAYLSGREYFCGVLSVADIALFMSVHYCQRLGGPSIRDHLSLRDWYARLCGRPAFYTVMAEIRAADQALSSPVYGGYPDNSAMANLTTASTR